MFGLLLLWTLMTLLRGPVLRNVWPCTASTLNTLWTFVPPPALTVVTVPAGVSWMVNCLLFGPRLICRLVMSFNVMPPGWLAPTGPLHTIASGSLVWYDGTGGPPMQRLGPMPKPTMRNWVSSGTRPVPELFGPTGVWSKNI